MRLYAVGDLAVAGSDSGTGFLGPGPPRRGRRQCIRCSHGGGRRLVEVTPVDALPGGDALRTIQQRRSATSALRRPGFNDTVDPDRASTTARASARSGTSAHLGAGVRRRVAVDLALQRARARSTSSPPAPTQTAGQTASVKVTARNSDGSPDAGPRRALHDHRRQPGRRRGDHGRRRDGGDHAGPARRSGTDTLTAFVDRDGNGVRDVNTEPRQTVTVTVRAARRRRCPASRWSCKVVSGTGVHQAPGQRARAPGDGPAKGFVPFTGAANIPVGSQLDTSKGRVALTSAADTGGAKTQTSDFYHGIFQVKQAVPKKKPKKPKALITDLVMKGQIARSQCAPLKGARAAATPRRRRAQGGARASCGAAARASSARTASTAPRRCAGRSGWCEDRCEGTLTKVTRGTVQVRDFKRKKTVTVKAGPQLPRPRQEVAFVTYAV